MLTRTEHQKSPYSTPAVSTGGTLRFGNVFSTKPVLTEDSYKPNVSPRGVELHNDEYRKPVPPEGSRPALSSYLARELHLKTPADEPLTWTVLKNGHQLLIVQKPGDLVGVRTFIDAGSIVENAVKPSALYKDIGLPSGIAHLDEHCHFLTTKNYPIKNQWSDEVEKAGANANASTDNEEIQHELFFNRAHLQKMLQLHAESVLNPTYNAQDIHQEKSAVLNEVALRTKRPAFKLENKLDELFFDRPASQTGGKSEDVENTTPEQLKRFSESTYHPDHMVTVVAGNVNPQEVLSILGPILSRNKNQGPVSPNKGMLLALNGIKTATLYDPEWNNSRLLFGFPAPALKDYKDRMAMEFLREALNGSVNSPLRKKLVTESSIAQSTSLEYEPLKGTGVLRLRVICSPGKEYKALNTSLETLQSMATTPLGAEKMNLIRERLVSHFKTNSDTVDHTSYQMGSEAVSGTLPYYLNYETLANATQAQDIMHIAQHYLSPERYALVYGLPPKPIAQTLALKFGQDTITPYLKPSDNSVPSPVSTELKNGIKVDLLQTPNRHQSAVDFILPLSHELNGSTSLLKGLLMDGSEETRQQVADLQEKDICIGMSSTYNKLLLSARCPKGKEEAMIKGLMQLLQQPNWSHEDFKRLSEESKSAIQEQVHNPDFPLKLSLREALYGLHQPYSLTPQDCVEKINAQSLDTVFQRLQRSMAEQPLHILMASPMSLTEQKTLIEKQMDAWQPKSNPFANLNSPPVEGCALARGGSQVQPNADKTADKVGILLVPNDTIKRARINIVSQTVKPGEADYPAFLVLNMILGGHSEGSFFNKLRTEDGLVYGVSTERSSLPLGKGRWYEVSMEGDFNKIPPAIHDLLAVTQNTINKPPSPELLQTAKDQFLLALSERTQTAWGSILNEEPWLIENLPPTSQRDLQNAVKQVSADDVHRVAQKIFASPQRTQLIGISAPSSVLKQIFPGLPLTQPVS